MTLYNIKDSIANLFDDIADAEGKITDKQLLELENLQESYETKVNNIGMFIKNLDAEAEAIKAEEERLRVRRKAAENKAARLRRYLGFVLDDGGFKSATISISKRTTKSVFIPENFLLHELVALGMAREEIKYVPDKKLIKEKLEKSDFGFFEDEEGNKITIQENKSIIIR